MLNTLEPQPCETDALSPRLQRSTGSARVVMRRKADGTTALADLAQQGCAKAMLPRVHAPVPEVVFLNTAGGVTGGDSLSYRLDLEAGAQATGATQTAERTYRSSAGTGEMRVHLTLASGARLDWLPQETILFDGSATCRCTEVEMAADATLLWCETLVFGRAAMGEALSRFAFRDDRQVRRDGKLVLWEPLTLDATHLAPRACLGGARAIATVAFLAPDAEAARDTVRRLAPEGVDWAVSAWDGKLVLRAFAPDAQPLKHALAQVLHVLREGAPLPRVWQL
ncbi:urease accessory protein UreD [Dinoroseobacter sp. PD6]|nr:urease accessory protein UreD [Dinoroseobacter sp. PD6]MDD9716379.1 urease accessory protein UreD [Dinoroseobacter sp. PD6]